MHLIKYQPKEKLQYYTECYDTFPTKFPKVHLKILRIQIEYPSEKKIKQLLENKMIKIN